MSTTATLLGVVEGTKAVVKSTTVQEEFDPVTDLGLPTMDGSQKSYADTLAKLRNMTTDSEGTAVSYTQIAKAMARLKTNDMSILEASYEQNINVFANMMDRAATDVADEDWIMEGSDVWLTKNKPYMSEAAYNDFVENPPYNEGDARLLIDRYAREESLTERVYSEGLLKGLGSDILTGLASPQDLWMYALPWIKGGKILERVTSGTNNWVKLGKAGLLGSAVATYSEGSRQMLAGIDLDDEYMVAGLGFFFGGTLEGISQGWARLSGKEKEEFIGKVTEFGEGLKALSNMPTTKTPKSTPVDTSVWNDVGVGKGTTSVRYNPAPSQRLYGTGNAQVYAFTSKMMPSSSTLSVEVDGVKTLVIQGVKNAYELNTKHTGVGDTYQGKMLRLEKQAKKEYKMKPDEFSDAVHEASVQTDLAHRFPKAEKKFFQSQVEEINETIGELEATIADKRSSEVDIEEAKDALEVYKDELTAAQGAIKKVASPELPEIENPLIKQAVAEKETLYKYFNDVEYKIEADLLASDHADNMAKMQGRLQAAIYKASKNVDPDVDMSKVEARIEKMEADIELAKLKYKKDATNLEIHYTDRSLGYSARYWQPEALKAEGDHVEVVAEALREGPQAKVLQKHDPEAYEEFLEDVDDIAASIVRNVRDAKDINSVRDIAGLRNQSRTKGNKFRAKSEAARVVDVDENLTGDLTQRHWNDVTMSYVYDMGHKLSTREALGVRNAEEFHDKYLVGLSSSLKSDGFSPKEITSIRDDAEAMLLETLGTRTRLKKPDDVDQQVKRALMDFNNIRAGMGFVGAQLTEMGPATKVAGYRFWKELGPAIKQTFHDYRKNRPFDETDSDVFKAWGMGSTLQKSGMSSRFDDGRVTGGNSSLLHKGANASMHSGLMMGLLNAQREAVPKAYMFRVHRIAEKMSKGKKKLSKAETKQFARWGLAPEDFLKISQQKLRHEDGSRNLSLEGWPEDVKEIFQRTIIRATREAILDPTGYDIPKRMSDVNDAIVPLITHYLRFPAAAYNRLLRNGMKDHDARTANAIMISLVMKGLYDWGSDQIAHELGFTDDATYTFADKNVEEWFDDETFQLLAKRSAMYNPFGSVSGKFNDLYAASRGVPAIGSDDYVSEGDGVTLGAGYSTAKSAIDFMWALIDDNEFNKAGQNLIPGVSAPFGLGKGVKKGIEHVAEEYIDPALEKAGDIIENVIGD